MDYIGIIEEWLYNYKGMKLQSESLKILYREKEAAVSEGHAIDYSKDKLSQSYKITSEVENLALDLALLSDRIKHLDSKLTVLEKGIERLSAKEMQILKLRYMESKRINYTDQYRNYKWYEISNMVGYAERHCRRIKKEAVSKLAKTMFGI